jgi:hypothetical protein
MMVILVLRAASCCLSFHLFQVEHMISEKQIMETISLNKHPFIVNMITSFKDERKLYILLEYVPGGEFFSYLRRVECFDADAARFYAACVAEVFGYLHAMNVIYRDLKPEVRIGYQEFNISASINPLLHSKYFLYDIFLQIRTFCLIGKVTSK